MPFLELLFIMYLDGRVFHVLTVRMAEHVPLATTDIGHCLAPGSRASTVQTQVMDESPNSDHAMGCTHP